MIERIITPEVTSVIVSEALESAGNALGQYFNFLPFHRILEEIPSLRRKISALNDSLRPFKGSLDNCQEVLGSTEKPLFDPVQEQVIRKYGNLVSTKIATTNPPKRLSEEEVKVASQSLIQELAKTTSQAVCFALQRERISYRLNPFGLLLQIHNLGAWRTGFYPDFDEQTKSFVFFPLLLEGRRCLAFFRLGPGKEISWLACDIRAVNNQDLSGFYPYLTNGKDLNYSRPAPWLNCV